MADREQLLTFATEIVSAHISNNTTAPDQLPTLIQQVFNTLAAVEQKTTEPPRPDPAVPIKQSVRPDHIACLECGKQFAMIKRHLATDHQFTPEQYRQRWGLPVSLSARGGQLCKGAIGVGKDRLWSEGCACEEEGRSDAWRVIAADLMRV